MLEAFFVEERDFEQFKVRAELAEDVGLDRVDFAGALRTRRYHEAHRKALEHANTEAGVTGVPMFVIGTQVLTGLRSRDRLEGALTAHLGGVGV